MFVICHCVHTCVPVFQWAWCCLTLLSTLSCSYLCSLVSSPQLTPGCSGFKPRQANSQQSQLCGFTFSGRKVKRAKDSKKRGTYRKWFVSRLSFHALCLCNRASGGGYAGLSRMAFPRGAFGAGFPGSAPRAAGPALHHEQTVGKTVTGYSFCCCVLKWCYMLFELKASPDGYLDSHICSYCISLSWGENVAE